MASIESRNLIHHDSSLSSDNEDLDVDGESAASIMESVREQEQQFAILTKEIENERRTVAKQLNHDRLNNMEYSDEMEANSYFPPPPHNDFVTETVSRREDYGDPREETEVLIDENGVSKTVTKRIVTKTVTERRVRQVEEHDSLPRNHSGNGVRRNSDRDKFGSMHRRPSSSTEDETVGLLERRPSESSSDSDRARQPVGYKYPPQEKVSRPVQPEKFQPEDYGLEDDRRSDYSDDDGQYGLEPGSGGYGDRPRRRSNSSESVESDANRYDEQLEELPISPPRNDVARAPLATQEAGSRASLDRLGTSWKTPTLPEVIKMLSYNMPVVQKNAAGYLQHLCFNNDQVKTEVRKLAGIPPLIKLLDNGDPHVEQYACGSLRNLSYGFRNDQNKIEIKKHEGVPAVVRLIRSTKDIETKERATGTLWNLSAHPELKGQVLELGLEPLVNLIVIPYSETVAKSSKPKKVEMLDVFTNAVGVIRNLSSTDSQDNRRKLRQCEGLVFALISVLQANQECENIDNKATENCLCVLRNLTYKLQDETPNAKEQYTLEKPRNQPTNNKSDVSCFGKKKTKEMPEVVEQVPANDPDASGAELLWQPDNSKLYIALLQETNRDEIIEASLGALLNLTSGVWQWATYARTVVRKEKGLPVVIDRLRTDNDQIVRAGAITLTNLAEDHKNKELIGKFAMKDLVYKLPGGSDPSIRLSDTTTIAVLNTLRLLVEKSQENVRYLREAGGVERITTINNARDNTRFHARVVKASGQVLKAIWANKQTRSLLKADGWNKNHFIPTVTTETLPKNPAGSRTYEEPRSAPTSTGGRRAEREAAQDQTELPKQEPVQSTEDAANKKDSWV